MPIIARTDQFTRVPSENVYVSEASDLGIRPGQNLDDGIELFTEGSKDSVRFTVRRTEFDREGDLLWWDLQPTIYGGGEIENAVTLRIFND